MTTPTQLCMTSFLNVSKFKISMMCKKNFALQKKGHSILALPKDIGKKKLTNKKAFKDLMECHYFSYFALLLQASKTQPQKEKCPTQKQD